MPHPSPWRLVLPVGLALLVPRQVLAAPGMLPALSWADTAALVLLLVALGAAAVAWGRVGNMARTIRSVVAASRRLAAGDLHTPVEGAGPEEVAAVAAALERIRHQLIGQKGALEDLQAAAAIRERERAAQEEALKAELAARAGDLAVFQALASALSHPADRGPAYEPFLSQLLSHIGMDAGALYLVVGEQRELHLLAHAGHNPASVEAMARLPLGEGFAGRVALGGDPIATEDAGAEARLVRDVVRLEGFHGLAAVPLTSRGQTLGVLEVMARARRKLGGDRLLLLQAVGQHISLALVSAALQDEAERRAGLLHSLALTQSLTGSMNPEDLLSLALLAAVQLLELAYVRVWLWDLSAGRLRPGPWHGQADLAEDGGPEGQVAALAARGGGAVFIPHLASDARCPEPRWWAKRGAASLAALPLAVGERTLGALTVVPRGASTFPEEDRELLGILADHLAVAVENARRHRERAGGAPGAPSGDTTVSPLAGRYQKVASVGAAVDRAAAVAPRPEVALPAEALAALDAAVAGADDVESALEVIADETRHIVGADAVAVFQLDPLRPGGAGRPLRLAAGGLQLDAGARLDGEAGVAGRALFSRAPRAAMAPFAEDREETLETLAFSAGYLALAAAPIVQGEALAGALAACRRLAEPFDDTALAALAAVAARVGALWKDRAPAGGLEDVGHVKGVPPDPGSENPKARQGDATCSASGFRNS